MKKKINSPFLYLGVFIVVILIFVAVSGNEADEGESAMDEYNKDSTSLIVSNGEGDKINAYQKGYDERKNPKNVDYVTPDFKIEESNLADKTEKTTEEPVKEKSSSDGQVSGSYNSPYGNNNTNNTTPKETEKKQLPKEEEEESLFNISTRKGSGGGGGKYKAVIHNDQKIRDGGSVRIRLQEDATVNGKTVPRNTIFYGTLSGAGSGRLQISISQFSSIASGSATVLDTDYQPGIKYDQAVESGVVTESKSIGRQITSDILSRLPAGRYASSLVRSARASDGSIYLVDGYKVIVQVN